jgi:membrane-bound lytic murein transglycosylase A
MQGIRDWLREHPEESDAIMNMNPSYIFFKLSSGTEMAKGALGIPLTPMRSVAVDDDRAAYGVPTFIDGRITEYLGKGQIPLQQLFVSQDTGGALKGPHRGDIFFGRGEKEEWQAGHQNAQGNVYWLLPIADGVKLRDGLPPTKEELEAEAKAKAAQEALPVGAVPQAPEVAPVSEPTPDVTGTEPAVIAP